MKKNTRKVVLEIGAGLAAAGAAAGYYFYGSEKAKKHRKIAAKWATNMKNDVVTEAKRLGKTSPEAIAAIVDRVAKTYQGIRAIDREEVKRAAKELRANWDKVQGETKRSVKRGVSRTKTALKKAKKRVTKRA